MFIAYGAPYLVAGLLKLLQDSLAFLQPLLLRALLSYISEYQENKGVGIVAGTTPVFGYVIAVVMFATSIAQTVILHQVTKHFIDCHSLTEQCLLLFLVFPTLF